MNKGFSIVIPVFNESNSIINLLDEIKSNLKEEKIMYEVIVVDDHSNDNSVSNSAGGILIFSSSISRRFNL